MPRERKSTAREGAFSRSGPTRDVSGFLPTRRKSVSIIRRGQKQKQRPFSRLRTHCRRDIFLLVQLRRSTSWFATRNRAPKVRRARLCAASLARATHGRSARVAAVEASDSPRERTRGTNAGGRAAPERAERRVGCRSSIRSAGEAASRDEAGLDRGGSARARPRKTDAGASVAVPAAPGLAARARTARTPGGRALSSRSLPPRGCRTHLS